VAAHHSRNLIRFLSAVAFCAALSAGAAVPVPQDLPAVAVGQAAIYRLEVALLVFYGALLLITPAFAGLLRGRLPIEISTRGAKFAEEVDQAAELNEVAIKELDRTTRGLTDGLNQAKTEIDELRKSQGDN
jgi:hypothetical protein